MTDPSLIAPVTEAELHAFADRQLTAERAAEVTAWLAGRPDEAARVNAWQAQWRALRALFDPVLDETPPPALQRRASRRAAWWGRPPLAVAARAPDSFAARAAMAHAVYVPEVKRPVEVDGAHEDQLVAWLSKRMGAPKRAPHLQGLGYALEGGRLLPGERGPVAQFMYRDEGGHRLTLYVSNDATPAAAVGPADLRSPDASRPDTAFSFAKEGPLNVFCWRDGPLRYALTAAADRAALTQVSAEVYKQLEQARP